ncbi:sensor domain-containing diguanylate cyclase [Noviherbaspirillum saxi]|uniref:diguanylate cyclase n=1 Tax=Noviherbaspirillum saxi TaxID=2320863 RepID=A0A3A3FX21_9BURK|nr:sensor domain-containing diguanylate cyclase [Noviherbaspirillum saxi]RJF99914.1 sensor domain-containing diguanylate cyclase [Noviherbaspirillum saxi]
MTHDLVAENRRLREQLTQLLEQAQQNQQILLRHQAFDLQFISAGSLRELLDTVFTTFAQSAGLDVVTLALLDPDYDIRRILVDLNIQLATLPHLLFVQEEIEFGELAGRLSRPVLGAYSEELHGRVFPEPIAPPASVAIIPLIRHGQLIGCMNLGSADGARFAPALGTDFIEHLASIVAICVENVINTERLKHIGLTDPLTGVNNRRYIERRLHEEIGRSFRQGYALSCMYIDIDHFKQINDRLGHQAGDEVLRGVAARIKAELRSSDALGRFGGEEFVVLLIDTEQADAVNVAERIRLGIAEHPLMLISGQTLDVTVSLGVAALDHQIAEDAVGSVAKGLIAQADNALYQAKEAGRNRVIAAKAVAA